VAPGFQGEDAERKIGYAITAAEHELLGDTLDVVHVHWGLGDVVEFADDQGNPPWLTAGEV
jgi:hypothetical protein